MPDVRSGPPSNPWQTKPDECLGSFVQPPRCTGACKDSGVSTGWSPAWSRTPFVLHRFGEVFRVSVASCVGVLWPSALRRSLKDWGTTMTTARITEFLNTRRPEGPCLVVDLDVVRDNFKAFRHALPDSAIYYAVKANPARKCCACSPVSAPTSIARPSPKSKWRSMRCHRPPHLLRQHDQEGAGRRARPRARRQSLRGRQP